MKFKVDRDVLTEAATWTARSLPNRPAVPVLAGVRLSAQDGILTLSAFDYEISARCELPAEIEADGEVLVLGRLLSDIAKSLPNKPVIFESDENSVSVTCGASHFNLLTMPLEDYPALPTVPKLAGQVTSNIFTDAVTQVAIAASKDDTLPLLTAVLMEVQGEKIVLMATDRYRLAMRELNWNPTDPEVSTSALVRARTLVDVAKSMTAGEDIQISLDTEGEGSLIGFAAGGKRTTSQLVEGEYFPVRRLFPDHTTSHAIVETTALIEAVKRVALVAERNAPIRLTFTDGELVLEAGQGENAQASEAVHASLIGEDLVTAYNPPYLLEGLGVIHTPYVRFSFTHPTKPAELTGQKTLEGDDERSFRYLLMPLRGGI